MATSSSDSVFGIAPQQYAVSAGATNALYLPQVALGAYLNLKYISGGSMLLMSAGAQGTTLSAAALAAAHTAQSYYLMGTTEVKSYIGDPTLYVAGIGATTVFVAEVCKSPGV